MNGMCSVQYRVGLFLSPQRLSQRTLARRWFCKALQGPLQETLHGQSIAGFLCESPCMKKKNYIKTN